MSLFQHLFDADANPINLAVSDAFEDCGTVASEVFEYVFGAIPLFFGLLFWAIPPLDDALCEAYACADQKKPKAWKVFINSLLDNAWIQVVVWVAGAFFMPVAWTIRISLAVEVIYSCMWISAYRSGK